MVGLKVLEKADWMVKQLVGPMAEYLENLMVDYLAAHWAVLKVNWMVGQLVVKWAGWLDERMVDLSEMQMVDQSGVLLVE
jgi:hypothetical protein